MLGGMWKFEIPGSPIFKTTQVRIAKNSNYF